MELMASDRLVDVDADVEMECLANWTMNGEQYALGRLHGVGFTSADQRYRCMVCMLLSLRAVEVRFIKQGRRSWGGCGGPDPP